VRSEEEDSASFWMCMCGHAQCRLLVDSGCACFVAVMASSVATTSQARSCNQVVVASNQVIMVAYVAPAADASNYMASNCRLERLAAWRCLPGASLGLLPALACRAPCSAYTRERPAAAGSFSCTCAAAMGERGSHPGYGVAPPLGFLPVFI
jgi:hypothetical protein